MHIVTAIPIGRGIGADSLSYFSKESLPPGSLIRVPVRSRTLPALVVSSTDVADEKLGVKEASFTLKKIPAQKPHRIFTHAFMKAATALAEHHATTIGAVVFSLTPSAILEKPNKLVLSDTAMIKSGFMELVAQAPSEERFSYYRSRIREAFARNESVIVIVPTIWDAVSLGALFTRGIEHRSSILHGGMTPKTIRDEWNRIADTKEPMLIVATGGFLSVPRADIGVIIVEHEVSEQYIRRERPALDIRISARECARAYGAHIIYGDTIVSAETFARVKSGDASPALPPVLRFLSPATNRVIDMRTNDDEKGFSILSDEVLAMSEHLREDNGSLFLLVGQSGLASTVLCRDCGSVISCKKCGDPLTVHEKTATLDRRMSCHSCGVAEAVPKKCEGCNGWNLGMFGVGTDGVAEVLTREAPQVPLFRLEGERVKSHREAANIVSEWVDTPGSILIGTTMALPYLPSELQHSAVVSIDALFGIPDFRIHEKIMSILTELRLRTKGFFILQTRAPQLPLVAFAIEGNGEGFYTHELETREMLGYPPFTTLILLSQNTMASTEIMSRKQIEELFAEWSPQIFLGRGGRGLRALITLPVSEWPHAELITRLRTLPQSINISINPRSVA